MYDRLDSFPCIICGVGLTRVMPEAEGQPDDGVMCQTHGNYGSTIFDPEDYSYLAFNICDPCLVKAGDEGKVMITRIYAPVSLDNGRYVSVVGRIKADRPYIPWHNGLSSDDNSAITLEIEELDKYVKAGKVELHPGLTIKGLKDDMKVKTK